MDTMRITVEKLKPLLIFLVLMGCAASVSMGAGCRAYAEWRLTIPWEALAGSPLEVVQSINYLDARMDGVCNQ